jgi:hypothetical protein
MTGVRDLLKQKLLSLLKLLGWSPVSMAPLTTRSSAWAAWWWGWCSSSWMRCPKIILIFMFGILLCIYYYFIRIVESILGPLGTSATERPIVPAPSDCDDGEFGGMKIGRGNRSTRRKPAHVPLCPPQIPLDPTRARIRAATVGSQRLTAWAMTRPLLCLYLYVHWDRWHNNN